MRINTNVGAIQAHNNLTRVQDSVNSSMRKLSSGLRITTASDDAAGLGIANKLRADIRSLQQASRNADQANSVLSIADGAAGSVQKMLERMKELAAEAASDTVDGDSTTGGRSRITAEYQQLRSEIDRQVNSTKYQGNAILNGAFGATVDTGSTVLSTATAGVQSLKLNGAGPGTLSFSMASNTATATLTTASATTTQIVGSLSTGKGTVNFSQLGFSLETTAAFGAATLDGMNATVGGGQGTFLIGSSGDYSGNDKITLSGASLDLTSTTLGISTDPSSLANAQTALSEIDSAIDTVNTAIGLIGANQSRIQSASDNLKTVIQNFQASESTIRDLDMADEMTAFSKNQILAQAGTAMLAQANQTGQGVLQLLRG
jgi:flagellin